MNRFIQLIILAAVLAGVMLLGKSVIASPQLAAELTNPGGQGAPDDAAAKTWNTFFGGSGDETATLMALDSKGNILVSGATDTAWGTPKRAYTSGEDGFVAKVNPKGALLWNTFIGANGYDELGGIAVDADGNSYVTGGGSATWGAPKNPYNGGGDVIVAKVDSNGVLQWNTFLGGSAGDGGSELAVTADGGLYVVGVSESSWGTPVNPYAGGSDAFVAKLNAATGALEWNTFLGGVNDEYGRALAVDSHGNAYVVGESHDTWGSPQRAFSTGQDAFAAKLSRKGVLKWNTFLGGSGEDWALSDALDALGNLFVAGTSSATWGTPTLPFSGSIDAQISKLNTKGVLEANTFVGNSATHEGSGIAISSSGNVYVAGQSTATWGTPKRPFAGPTDAFVAELNNSLHNLKWNTFIGGTGNDNGRGIVVDGTANVFVTGFSDTSWGNPKDPYTAKEDAFVAKFH